MKFFFFLVFLTSASFAKTLILHNFVSAGPFGPQANFVKDCKIFDDGFVLITKEEGPGPVIIYKGHITYLESLLIRSLLSKARKGRIETRDASCDGGDRILHGYLKGEEFILNVKIACGEHKINRSVVAPVLKKVSKKICGF